MIDKLKKPGVVLIIVLCCLFLIAMFLLTYGGTGEGSVEKVLAINA